MGKVDPWVWFWPALLLLQAHGCQQEHLYSMRQGKPTMYQGFVKGLTEGETDKQPVPVVE